MAPHSASKRITAPGLNLDAEIRPLPIHRMPHAPGLISFR
jgi:hypothetical protein